jgi:methylated-DNA-[protein]-cysteine S-methyltransferase
MTRLETNTIAPACYTHIETRLGRLLLVGARRDHGVALRGVYFDGAPHADGVVPALADEDGAAFSGVREQLDAYLRGERRTFDIELAPAGTEFQRSVWRALAQIRYGMTATYAQIAQRIGRPRAVRAVGAANGRNPLSIVVPCHRVIGSDGTLTGYAGGLPAKLQLLEIERGSRAAAGI